MNEDGLYKIPTINESVPPVEIIQNQDQDIITISREDWRQVEFVSVELEYFIESGFGPIRTIYRERKAGKEFSQIHKRSSLEEPLEDVILPVDEIDSHFKNSLQTTGGIALCEPNYLVQNGFAYRLNGLCLYGISDKSNAAILGLHPIGDNLDVLNVISLVEFARAKSLFLVDWKNMLRLPPSLEIYSQYFLGD